ncbi:chemotaxis protein CheX [Salibacterium halotolerans]|uniref:Chemotaxis protein CheX n=1 Tax=Salibacterium halotolerans TaxID=1884432 RepID=A0A1I5SW32_9BACI|nr:chemotaxis protein CheX [Salibacterium halotolerans]SFP74953.1 chemotaxis protein CheX [Salibacterium halotolerans]
MSAAPQMNAQHINAITNAAVIIVKEHLGMQTGFSKPYVSGSQFMSSDISVVMGVNGTLEGQIICTMKNQTALSIVGSMMGGMKVETLDEMGWSAIQEFGNWVAGRAASELAKAEAAIDISPPVINEGRSTFRVEKTFLTIPLTSEAGEVLLHVSITPRVNE